MTKSVEYKGEKYKVVLNNIGKINFKIIVNDTTTFRCPIFNDTPEEVLSLIRDAIDKHLENTESINSLDKWDGKF